MSIESVKKQYQDNLSKFASNSKEKNHVKISIDKIFDDLREHFVSMDGLENIKAEHILDGMFKGY